MKIVERRNAFERTYADGSPDDFSLMGTEDLRHSSCGFGFMDVRKMVVRDR